MSLLVSEEPAGQLHALHAPRRGLAPVVGQTRARASQAEKGSADAGAGSAGRAVQGKLELKWQRPRYSGAHHVNATYYSWVRYRQPSG